MTEAEMVNDCLKRLLKSNSYKEIITEVPYMSRCIDMVLVDYNNNIYSIEFKLKDWKRAIEQAKDHKLGADKSYICLPNRKVTDKLRNELLEAGIGLLLYQEDETNGYPLKKEIDAEFNSDRWDPWIVSLKDKLNRISNKEIFYEVV